MASSAVSAAPAAVSPYIEFSQAFLTEASNLQKCVRERYGKEDYKISDSLIGADYKVSLKLADAVKATYTFNSVPDFRSSSDRYHHIFVSKIITLFVPMFSTEEKTYNVLKKLLTDPVIGNSWMACHFRSTSPAEVNFVAVLAIPYNPLPGASQITAEEMSGKISQFLKQCTQWTLDICDAIRDDPTFTELPLTSQDSPPQQKYVLPNFSEILNDTFNQFASFTVDRLQDFRELEKTLYKTGDQKFVPTYKVRAFATSILGSEFIPYSPEFLVTGRSLEKYKFSFGRATPMPSFFMAESQEQASAYLQIYAANAQQLLPSEGTKIVKYKPSCTSAKEWNLLYAIVQEVRFSNKPTTSMEKALSVFRESAYGLSGLNFL